MAAVALAFTLLCAGAPLIILAFIPKPRKRAVAWIIALLPTLAIVFLAARLWAEFGLEDQLNKAAEKGDRARVSDLLDAGVSPDAMDIEGTEAILAAIQGDHWDIVGLLVRRGAHNANSGDGTQYSGSAAYACEEAGHKDWAETLGKRGYRP